MRKRNAKGRKPNCSKCGGPKERPGQAWCNKCIAEWARKHRPKHRDLPDEPRRKANARSYVKEYVKRGIVIKGPCCVCGTREKIEAHHPDYSKPLEVIWYCRFHHLEFHKNEQSKDTAQATA